MLLSAMQVEHGLKRGEPVNVAAMLELKPDKVVEILDEVAGVLREFKDMMPPEPPKHLPPWRAIDHQIDLIPGVKPPAKAPYWMSPLKLQELRKQLTKLLDAGYIQPSKAPYGAPVLF